MYFKISSNSSKTSDASDIIDTGNASIASIQDNQWQPMIINDNQW